ncbi:Serine/threonine-protein kinase Smg1, partial [Pseudolycoriella hygida]
MLRSSANTNEVILQVESGGTEVTQSGSYKDGVKDSIIEKMTRTRNDFNDRNMSNQSYRNANIISSNELLNITSISGKNFNAATLQSNLPEDMRISKLLRRLCVEKNTANAIDLCGKLKTVILEPNNTAYIRRSFDILTDSIVYLLKECPQECLDDVIDIFGMMGYVVRHDITAYKTWIVKSYKNQQLRIPVMKALHKTFKMDANSRDLMPQCLPKFIELLKDFLDAAEKTELFVVITKTIKQFSLNYPRLFEPHFTDIVDIVVGWHLEIDQTDQFKEHCSDILQGFHTFWTSDTNFANNLLSQFLEDIIVSESELDGRISPSYERTTSPEMGIASLIGAFSSVIKCTWESPVKLVKTIGKDLLMESFEKIVTVTTKILGSNPSHCIVVTCNEFVAIILDCYEHGISAPYEELFSLIRIQLEQVDLFNENQISSFLYVVLKTLVEIKTDIPFKFVADLFSSDSKLCSLKFIRSKQIQSALIKIYQEVLNLKNISLLEEAYRHILRDLGAAFKVLTNNGDIKWPTELSPNLPQYTVPQAEVIINFYLTSLSSLALSNSSIIAMYGLKPNIFELLVFELQTTNLNIWSHHKDIHYVILTFLYAHCRKNHYFISTSSLLNSASAKVSTTFNSFSLESTTSSPTSHHFSMILTFLEEILNANLMEQLLPLVFEWCKELFLETSQYSEVLSHESKFTAIIQNIATLSVRENNVIKNECANCLDALYNFATLNDDVLKCIAEICCVHMCSSDAKVRERFSFIFATLPLNVSLHQVNDYTGVAKDRAKHIAHYQHWHNSRQTHGEMSAKFFKEFINALAFKDDAVFIENMLKDMFTICWYEEEGNAGEFSRTALSDLRCLVSWAQWEAAQYCVNNKLRTSLGKPQETFMKIELIIKEDARILAMKEKAPIKDLEALLANQKHTRILLGFLEALEKAIYNASEGTAYALPAPEKPARTFFHINAPTCNEWFNRIRTAVDLVALHCLEPEMVIRYSESVLKTLAAQKKTNEPLFEHTLMSHAWALLRNGESDALYGLYVWTKAVTNRKFVWVKFGAEQAAGHRDSAIDGYKSILKSTEEPLLDRHIRDFIADQLTVCYLYQYRWNELRDFLIEEEKIHRVTIPLISITSSQLNDTIEFLQTRDISVFKLGDWETLESGTDVVNDFSYHKLISVVENTLIKQDCSSEPYDENISGMCFSIAHSCLQECLRTNSREHLNNATIFNHISQKIVQKMTSSSNNLAQSFCVDKSLGSVTLSQLLCWADFINDFSDEVEQVRIDLRLDLCSLSRKDRNYNFCETTLTNYFIKNGLSDHLGIASNDLTLKRICEEFLKPSVAGNIALYDENTTRAVYETAKYMYCQDNKETAIQFGASAAIGICQNIALAPENEFLSMRGRLAKFLLSLSEWVQGENEKLLTNNEMSPLNMLVSSMPVISPNYDAATSSTIPAIDVAVGKIIQHSIKQCPNLAKAYGAFGNWCYRWGRKMVEQRTEHGDKTGLRKCDITAINNLVPTASTEDISNIVQILNTHQVSSDDEEIGVGEACSTEMIESQLRTVPILADLSDELIHSVVEIWRQAHKAVYNYYEMSADAYFKYLQLSTNNVESDETSGDCSVVTATLRLLRLIVKHALGLQEVLESGLASTPTNPWKVIIPQLFSRLNHHEPYVRKRVSELLCRLAQDSPHLIIFPAVVGSDQEKQMDITDISLASIDLDHDEEERNDSNTGLTSCFNSLLDILVKQTPETVHQVQLLVRELKRVTLLWDELWLVALNQAYSECTKRLTTFESDLKKMSDSEQNEKLSVLSKKYKLLMKPVVFVMERLQEITGVRPETNNERLFQEKYSTIIAETIAALQADFNLANPNESWTKFKNFFSLLQQRAQKRSSCTLKMLDISPVLAQMKNTAISMPGVDNDTRSSLNIKAVDNVVHILPTKTKPKKLVFHGSDGKRYTYLFKGLEDLHLDERIMQFLSIANSMMTKSTDCKGNVSKYRARHYSVIPLGPRSGLISWVDGVTPIFALYKKWQQRDAANLKKDKKQTLSRPSEIYLNKLAPLLALHNLKITDNRKEWPLEVLKQVLSELSAETPHDLLSKELWCYSTNAAQWRQVVRNYSQSIAVMSVIGYVIGLGDRHLDNILIELSTGEVVHIDYNVCFEKGKTLRVPEKVPFRMTANLEEALGVTGIEGTFRLACEHVLKALRRGRETLLTLLEAFVYDPLVDWAVGEDGDGGLAVSAYGGDALGGDLRHARKQLEHEVTRDTLAIRFTEIKSDWTKNRNDVYHQLKQMKSHLQILQHQRIQLKHIEANRVTLSNQLAMVREAEALGSAMGSHSLNTLSQRYAVYKRTKNEFTATKHALVEKSELCFTQIATYKDYMKNIANNLIYDNLVELNSLTNTEILSEFNLVWEFLENSAQSVIFAQGDQTNTELKTAVHQQTTLVKQIFETLIQYGNVVNCHPQRYIEQHRLFQYGVLCKQLATNETAQACREVVEQFQKMFGENVVPSSLQQSISLAYQLQTVVSEEGAKLTKYYDRYHKFVNCDETSILRLDTVHSDAKAAISLFLLEENGAVRALECVTLTALCDLNKKLLMMEKSFSNSGDSLVDLTLNGKWFFDELFILTSTITELADLICTNDSFDSGFMTAIDCLHASKDAYLSLFQMNNTFLSSILTKVIHGIISEDASVLEMISSLSSLQDGLQTIQELLTNLHLHLRCTVMDTESVHATSMDDARILRLRLDQLKAQFEANPQTMGSELFLSFIKLFAAVDEKHDHLVSLIRELNIRAEWKKIDQVKDSRDLAALIFNPSIRPILEMICSVKRQETMIEIFSQCLQFACTYKGNGVCPTYDDESLARPLKKFIADHVWRLQLGVASHSVSVALCHLLQKIGLDVQSEVDVLDVGARNKVSLEELCRKSVDGSIKRGEFSSLALNHASTLCMNFDLSWRKKESIVLLQACVKNQGEALKRSQLLLTSLIWMNEEFMASQPNFAIVAPMNRTSLLLQLSSAFKTVTSWQASIKKIREEINGIVGVIVQRLKWAAGANPAIIELFTSFTNTVNANKLYFDRCSKLVSLATNYCESVLHYESLRLRTADATIQDQMFLNLASRWEKSCLSIASSANTVSPVEEALVELLDPEGPIDHAWLSSVAALIDDMTDQVQSEINQVEKDIFTSQDNLYSDAQRLRTLMGIHHRMAGEVRSLLRSTLRIDGPHVTSIKDYLKKYKEFLDVVSDLHGNVLSKDFTEEIVNGTLVQITTALGELHGVFDDLFSFEKDFKDGVEGEDKQHDSSMISPTRKSKKGTQTQQKRNAYAVSVWRRIRMKLEGRDPDPNRRCPVPEQVDWMIREAMNPDNLAVLYEGWTPWV